MDGQNTSMEELKVDEDENIKEVSMEEDILGAQSLLISESEDDDTGETKKLNRSPLKKLSPKGVKHIVDDDQTEDKDIPNDSCSKQIPANASVDGDMKRESPKRTKRIVDSDDDLEDTKYTGQNYNGNKSNKVKKISALIDSDSGSEGEGSERVRTQLTVDDTDSEKEIESIKNADKLNSDKDSKTKKKKKSKILDDSDDEQLDIKKKTKLVKNKSKDETISLNKKSNIIDSESETDSLTTGNSDGEEIDLDVSARAANFEKNNNENGNLKENAKQKTKVIRASAKKAMDEMQAIQSEQQRLHREAHISIPYHKPKKHTLQDFLNRKTIIKPLSENSPLAEAVRRKSLKMTQEELEEYGKLMEERANEAKEFFKSESEDDEKEVFMDNTGVFENPKVGGIPIETSTVGDSKDNQTQENIEVPLARVIQEEKLDLNGVRLTEEELAEILADEEHLQNEYDRKEQSTSNKVFITEIIELPKLDMKTVNISPVKKPKRSINVKQLLSTINLTGSPSLSGDANKLIDLETGDLIERKPSGVDNLMKRLLATVKARKSKNVESCNILSTENGKLEITKVNISLKEEKDPNKEPKPRAAYFELKKNLKEIIKKKRMEEMHKKQEDEFENSKCLEQDDEDDEDEAEEYEPESKPKKMDTIEIDEEENALALDIEDEEEDEEENGEDINEIASDAENQSVVEEGDNEEDEEDNEDDEDDGEDTDNDNDDCGDGDVDNLDGSKRNKRKNRIIKAFDDSDDEVDRDTIEFFKPLQPTSQQLIFDTQPSERNAEGDEIELMGLCSGTFDATQPLPLKHALMSQIPITQNQGKSVDDDILMELCSGKFEEQDDAYVVAENRLQGNKILSSDEEDQLHQEAIKRTKKLTKKLKKNTAKLEFSDDEEENEQTANSDVEEMEDDEEEVEAVDEEPETFIDYDSEENEVVVQMTKKECAKRAENFFENEAELSESEWGSADEDEKNLDKYDIELGDEDEFDKEKLRTELEQIHARKMLDEDMREVRKIQDMLFEDEEKDGVGRQRQFKWKNAENGFSLEDGSREENGEGANGDSGDELNEHQWRKIRYEREQFLKEQGLKPGSQDMSTTLPNTTLPSTHDTISNTTLKTTKKIQIITAKKIAASSGNSGYSEKSNPFLITKGVSAMHKKSVRGSFLVRDKDTLNKLAGFTKGSVGSTNTSDMVDTAGTVSIKGIKAQNFVFATLTEEEHQNLKRKSDDLFNSSNENGTNFMKKPKMEPRRDKCFIDQLL